MRADFTSGASAVPYAWPPFALPRFVVSNSLPFALRVGTLSDEADARRIVDVVRSIEALRPALGGLEEIHQRGHGSVVQIRRVEPRRRSAASRRIRWSSGRI